MRLFIYEFVCAGGFGERAPSSWRREGAAMLRAVVEDFQRVPGVRIATLLAHDFPETIGHDVHRSTPANEPDGFREVAAQCDAALVIAPEFDGLLAKRTEWALAQGCGNIGCTPEAIRLAGDKLALSLWLPEHKVPTPVTGSLGKCGRIPILSERDRSGVLFHEFPCVVKPRHGAGSHSTFLVSSKEDWETVFEESSVEMLTDELILQSFVPGRPASVAMLIGPRQTFPTPGATQSLSDDGRFRYLGGQTPLPTAVRARAISLSQRAVEAVPGLAGYVGVDLILGRTPDGSEDVVIEINPRLTTSYIGLRQLTRSNLAETWLRLWRGEATAPPQWSEELIDFTADGMTRSGSRETSET